MAIHLLLLATNEVHPGLHGSVAIFSNCISGLNKVQHLPPYWIPLQCQHSDILKTVLVHCTNLLFTRHYQHVKAHQDNSTEYNLLPRELQLNCTMDYHAKTTIRALNATNLPHQRRFLLKPMCAFVRQHKLTADMGDHLWLPSHLKMVRLTYHFLNILHSNQFDLVDWEMVHSLLCSVPKLFQLWLCKQVINIAATNANVYQ
jgi:hypothetical protein